MAGMWGAKLYQRRDLIEGLTRALIVAGQGGDKSTDQNSLNNILWPTAQFDVVYPIRYSISFSNIASCFILIRWHTTVINARTIRC